MRQVYAGPISHKAWIASKMAQKWQNYFGKPTK
jgi:hypothetical protein